MLDFGGSYEDHLHLIEFTHNNSYKLSIKMALLEALLRENADHSVC